MKKKFLKLCSFILVMFLMVNNVYALEVAKAGETVDDDGTYESLRFVAGNQVTSSATVDGINFLAGNDVSVTGYNVYGMYAGNIITISGTIEKDLMAAGNKIVITADAGIGRDVYLAANQIDIKTNINRDLRAGGSTINLSGVTVNGDAYLAAEKIILDGNTVINGTLTYYDESEVIGLDKAIIANVVTKETEKIDVEFGLKEQIYAFAVSVLAAFITMLCLFHFVPKTKEVVDGLDLSFGNIAKMACIGFAVLVAVPIVALFAIFTGFLTPLSIIILLIYGISIYLSSLFVSYIIGKTIIKKIFKKEDIYFALLLGILIVRLLGIIPIVGGYIIAVIIFYGLGIVLEYLKTLKNK